MVFISFYCFHFYIFVPNQYSDKNTANLLIRAERHHRTDTPRGCLHRCYRCRRRRRRRPHCCHRQPPLRDNHLHYHVKKGGESKKEGAAQEILWFAAIVVAADDRDDGTSVVDASNGEGLLCTAGKGHKHGVIGAGGRADCY